MARSSATRKAPVKAKALPKRNETAPVVPDEIDDEEDELLEDDELEDDEADEDGDLDEGDAEDDSDAQEASEPVVQATPVKDDAKLSPEEMDNSEFRTFYQNLLDNSGISAPEGRILFPGEPLSVVATRGRKGDDFVILTEDVYRMILPFRSKRPTFVIEALAGTQMNSVEVVSKAAYTRATNRLMDDINDRD